MFSLHGILDGKPDHPMFDAKEARKLFAGLLREYLGAPHLQDFQGLCQWQGMHGFMQTLAEAYAVCVAE